MSAKIALFIAAVMFTGKATAQQNTGTDFTKETLRIDYLQKVEKHRKMKNAGTGLIVVGSILLGTGTGLMVKSAVDGSDDDIAGGVCLIAGNVGLGAGIPLRIIGSRNLKRYTKQLEQLTVRVNCTPQTRGLTFTYRF